jgi:hypothetical protein
MVNEDCCIHALLGYSITLVPVFENHPDDDDDDDDDPISDNGRRH